MLLLFFILCRPPWWRRWAAAPRRRPCRPMLSASSEQPSASPTLCAGEPPLPPPGRHCLPTLGFIIAGLDPQSLLPAFRCLPGSCMGLLWAPRSLSSMLTPAGRPSAMPPCALAGPAPMLPALLPPSSYAGATWRARALVPPSWSFIAGGWSGGQHVPRSQASIACSGAPRRGSACVAPCRAALAAPLLDFALHAWWPM